MKPISYVVPAAVALAIAGPVHGADVPSFNQMDKNNDSQLSQSEAQANPKLADQFRQVDDDNDGNLSRAEYLAIMGRQDLYTLRENLAEFLDPEGKPPLAAGAQASAGATAGSQDAQNAQSLPPPVGEQLVRSLQDSLRAKGIDTGPVDGIWGPRTHAALREYQQRQDLEVSGQLDSQTLAALGIAAGSGGQGSASAGESRAPAEESGKAR